MPFLDWVNKNQAKEITREVPYHLLTQKTVSCATNDSSMPIFSGGFRGFSCRLTWRLLSKQVSAHGDLTGINAENLLIQGDNLLALKALIPFYAGRVKCIFIDPPYNTQSAFEHYDDKLEHSQWLSMMYPRLVLLRELLAEDGSIWVTLDDREVHYMKVIMDEVFGRANFVANVVWEKVYTPKSNGRGLSADHDHLLVFSKSKIWLDSGWNTIPRTEEQKGRFKNTDGDANGAWRTYPLDVRTEDVGKREKYRYEVVLPSGRAIKPSPGRHWALPAEEFIRQREAGEIYFGKDGDAMPTKKVYLRDANQGVIARTWWPYKEVTGNQDAKREVLALFGDSGFITPKPEKLIQRVLEIASNRGDLVLDSFLGSGTTAAVGHKMGRRFIGIEMGEHARTHCLPRLQQVIEGEQGGVSVSVKWLGGGGFRFCNLGEPAFDEHGRINSEVKFATLAGYVWHFETGEPGSQKFDFPLLGVHNGTAYYLLYNGILGDRRTTGGNVLTHAVLQAIHKIFPHAGPKVIYGETTRLGASRLAADGITFKQIPYDVKMR